MIETLLASADEALKRAELCPEWQQQAAHAQLAAAYIARADIAVRLRAEAGATLEPLRIAIHQEYWDRVTVTAGPDGTTLIIGFDYFLEEMAKKLWEITKTWRHAGWRVQFLGRSSERCGRFSPSDRDPHHYLDRKYKQAEEPGKPHDPAGEDVYPYCRHCGFVPPGNDLLEITWRPSA